MSEAFTPGSHATGTWLTAVFLILLFGFGLLVIIYLLAKGPPGYLTVIYESFPSIDEIRDRAAVADRAHNAVPHDGRITRDPERHETWMDQVPRLRRPCAVSTRTASEMPSLRSGPATRVASSG